MLFGKNKDKNKDKQINDDKIKVDTTTITTMIGSDTIFDGTLNTKASVRINGTVRGEVKSDGIVILTKSGHIEGTIEAESIIVAGRFDGNMSIRDKVNVEPSGQIYGEIITKKFVIDEESVFEGNVVMNRDGKIMPVTPYKPAVLVEREEELEKELRKKIEKELKEKAEKEAKEKKEKEEKDKDEKDKDKSDKDKDKENDKSDKDGKKDKSDTDKKDKDKDKQNKDGKDKKDDKDEPADEDNNIGNDDNKDDDKKEETPKDSEIIIADINEIKDGEDIPKTEAKDDDKKDNVVKSKSLSVEVQDE